MMRSLLVVASLLVISLVAAPSAQAYNCNPGPEIDQTVQTACGVVSWAREGGPSPVQTVPEYLSCYTHGQPPASWVPNCS